MNVGSKIQAGIGKVFDVLRSDVFLDRTDTLTLLTASTSANEFDEFFEIESKWFYEYEDELRKSLILRIADSSDDLTTTMETATHIRINEDVYAIRRGDTLPPKGTSFMWTIFADRRASKGNFVELW
jgi:hypothetical protein